jgi:hypothetical protein
MKPLLLVNKFITLLIQGGFLSPWINLNLTMKKTFFCCITAVIIFGCRPKQGPSIYLFNDTSFKLADGEKIIEIDSTKKESFRSFFDHKFVQIPLFRCIKSESYLIFLGIPYNTSLKKLADGGLKEEYIVKFFESDSVNYFYRRYEKADSGNIIVYTKNFDNNLVFVLVTSRTKTLSDSLFNKIALSNRFNN